MRLKKPLTNEQRARRNETQRLWRRNNPDKVREYKLKWHQDNPGANTAIGWKRRLQLVYNIDPSVYDRLFALQNGRCAICKKEETRVSKFGERMRLAVDHDHVTGSVRGLLCGACNAILGQLKDPKILSVAIMYLEGTLYEFGTI